MNTNGLLSLVATPIGNLGDITYRAIEVLKTADYILCEDTRVTGKLLHHFAIDTKMKRYDAHATERVHQMVIDDLQNEMHVALVSDAGTPGISDPGVLLVQQARENGAHIEVIPGPSAVTAAVSLAGFTGNQFSFLGFVPHKKGRNTFFETIADYKHPVVFYESTHRIIKTMQSLHESFEEKPVYVGKELTKLHEEMMVGTAKEILSLLESEPVKQKGEFVIIVDPR